MFLSPYCKGEGMNLGGGYYKPKRERGGGHQFRKKGDGIIDTLMGIGSTIIKHKNDYKIDFTFANSFRKLLGFSSKKI